MKLSIMRILTFTVSSYAATFVNIDIIVDRL